VALRKILSFLELVVEEIKQRTFRQRQYAVLESLYEGTMGLATGADFQVAAPFQ
jgi:hypothetical protein